MGITTHFFERVEIMPAATPVLEVVNVSKRLGNIQVLSDVSFSIHEGQIFALLGPNGAGKTTLLSLIVGLLRPSSGEVRFAGRPGEMAGFVGQPPIYPHLSGRENLFQAFYNRRLPVDYKRVDEVLEQLGLTHAADRPAGEYSTGMRQRLGIARALLFPARLIILDEPTGGLDPEGIVEIRELILRLNESGRCAWLITSHILSEVERIATRVGLLVNGRLCYTAEVDQIRQDRRVYTIVSPDASRLHAVLPPWAELAAQRNHEAEIRLHQGHSPAELNAQLVKNGIRVESLMPAMTHLEHIYLQACYGILKPEGQVEHVGRDTQVPENTPVRRP